MASTENKAVAAFISDLASHGVRAEIEGPAVVYSVEAVSGGLAGQVVPTAVSLSELTSWPAVPPHWVHFPDSVQFGATNADSNDCLPGWKRHSRDIGTWAPDRPPITRWLAHVRGIVTGAIR
jgi:hypothetical protein